MKKVITFSLGNKKTKTLLAGGIVVAAIFIAFFSWLLPRSRIEKKLDALNAVILKTETNFYLSHIKDESPGVGPGNEPVPIKDPEHFSFAVIGDTQNFNVPGTDGGFKKAVKQIEKMNPSLVMTVGDLVRSCDKANECANYKMWKNIAKPILPITYEVVGNHDRISGNAGSLQKKIADKAWQSYFNLPANGPLDYEELVYSFDAGNSHFIVLDSEKPKEHKIGQDQLEWLEKDLAANKKDNVFVFYHEPAFPISYKIGRSLDSHTDDRNALWAIFDKYNVTAVFNGHEHIFSRQIVKADYLPGGKNDIYQFIVGNTDANEKKDVVVGNQADYYHKGHSFVMVDVNGKEITVKLFSVDGELVDSFTFSK